MPQLSHADALNGARLGVTTGRLAASGQSPSSWATMIRPKKRTSRTSVQRWTDGTSQTSPDVVAVEEPLEIRIEIVEDGRPVEHSVSVTMRTPGDDFELSAGFLFTEGLITDRTKIADLRYCQNAEPQEYNIVTVRLRDPAAFDPAILNRNFYMTSSCGVCGKASLESVEVQGCRPLPAGDLRVQAEVIRSLPALLRGEQPVFERTGGIHAAGIFDSSGQLQSIREDVGRHNAVDKVVGEAFLAGRTPLADRALAVSGRASFEIMQKAAMAGIPVLVAVGAPSSLAVDFARRFNMTLIGFAKLSGFNVYHGSERIVGSV